MSQAYIRIRRVIRKVIKSSPTLDRAVGRRLVHIDIALRRLGVLRKTLPNPLSFRGMTVTYGDADRALAESIVTNETYEPETIQAIVDGLRVGDRFVDVGANIGLLSLVAAQTVGPAGEVIAFEPSPTTHRFLRDNLRNNGFSAQSTIEDLAVTDKPGTARFVITDASQFNAIDWGVDDDEPTTDVQATSLDDYFRRRGWPHVNMVKLDIEGHEVPAIRGMAELISRNPTMTLIIEYHRGVLARAGITGNELVAALRDVGFRRFTALVTGHPQLSLPLELPLLDRIAQRQNVNLLCRL